MNYVQFALEYFQYADQTFWLWCSVSGLLFFNVWLWKKSSGQMKNLRQQQQQDHSLIKNEIRALYALSGGVGEKMDDVESQIRLLQERLNLITLNEPSEKTYAQVVRMINSGADIDTVVGNSGLSRGEVELISLLKRFETKSENA